jgi:UDP-N-acetylmuramoylalanine--D-glutamate ligase
MTTQSGQVVADTKALVLGMGTTGVSIAAWLADQKRSATFADSRAVPPGLDEVRSLLPDAAVSCGALPASVPDDIDEVLVSPGLAMDTPVLVDALSRGIPVRSDIDLFLSVCEAKVLGITGSNGKSTVTSLVARMLQAAGMRATAGGNIGVAALDLLGEKADVVALELSSFQLERSGDLPLHAAVVLNLSPDHLDQHSDFATYAAAKQRIYARCGTAVVNRDAPELIPQATGMREVGFGLGIPSPMDWGVIERDDGQWIARGSYAVMPVSNLQIAGRHNLQNVLAAFALADTLDVPIDGLTAGAQLFAGLPHRMQIVASEDGINWIDDSKATNEAAALASINAVEGRLILIAGGDAKGGELTELAGKLKGRDVFVIALGKDAQLFSDRLAHCCELRCVADMEAAVHLAAAEANVGDTVLLAPACSSLDMYSGFAERGEHFVALLRELQ